MTSNESENMEEQFARWNRSTESIRPRKGFADRVMQAIENETLYGEGSPDLWQSVRRVSLGTLGTATIVAALTIVWALEMDQSFEDQLAMSYDSVELESE